LMALYPARPCKLRIGWAAGRLGLAVVSLFCFGWDADKFSNRLPPGTKYLFYNPESFGRAWKGRLPRPFIATGLTGSTSWPRRGPVGPTLGTLPRSDPNPPLAKVCPLVVYLVGVCGERGPSRFREGRADARLANGRANWGPCRFSSLRPEHNNEFAGKRGQPPLEGPRSSQTVETAFGVLNRSGQGSPRSSHPPTLVVQGGPNLFRRHRPGARTRKIPVFVSGDSLNVSASLQKSPPENGLPLAAN